MSYITKKDYAQLFADFMKPLRPYLGLHGLELGNTAAVYSDKIAHIEGFLRVLWGLVPFVAGNNAGCDEWIKIYNERFAEGTDRERDVFWGECKDGDQLFVEMTPIAYAMLFAADKFWEPLSEEAKDNLAGWLYSINEHNISLNNWQMFRVLINTALKCAGKKYSQRHIDEAFVHIENNYVGNGWYKDGYTQRRDYYISFAIHFYSLLYVAVMDKEDSERCAIYRARAEEFAKDFIYWFSDDGAAVPYGRSLIYRFAQVSFWSACLIADVKPFGYGVIKGIISRHMEDWLKYPVFDNAGILSIGYRYSNLFMTEGYNSPGSPYWSFKVFALLMLPDNHPFWAAEPEDMPHLDSIKTIKNAKMVLTRTKDNVCMFVPGFEDNDDMGQMECKYSKFVYSSKFGFSISRGQRNLLMNSPDNVLSFVINDFVFVRYRVRNCRVEDGMVYSEWSPFKGVEVETTLIPSPNGHIRKHKIISEYECEAYDSGFSVCIDETVEKTEKGNFAEVRNKNSYCKVSGDNSEGVVINTYPNTNILYNKTVIPSVKYKIKKGVTEIETVVEY